MTISKVIGTFTGISGSVLLYSFNKLHAKEIVDCHACHMKRLPKAQELPLYDKPDDLVLNYDEKSELPLSSEISNIRKQISGLQSYFTGFKEGVSNTYETGVAHIQSSYSYITSEENKIPRILVITSGGLAGYILARKRGLFKKVFYTSLGAGIVFTAFYPMVAKDYALIGWEHTKYHTCNALEKYGGYDTQKLADETKEKVDSIKNTLKLEGLTNKFKEWFENKEKITNLLNITPGKISKEEKSEENISKDEKK